MDLFDLHGKVALVTGGNGGIGLGMARALASRGASIAIAGRNADKTSSAVAEVEALARDRDSGGRVLGLQVDVTDAGQVERMVASTCSELDGLDILVANAGTNLRKPPESYSLDEWCRIVDTNLTAVFVCCQTAYPELKRRGGGKMITIGSMTSIFGLNVAAAYTASKGGIVQLTRSLASAWARDNIQVNAILPGWIDTDLTRMARQNVPGLHEKVLDRTPAGRWGVPDDLAGTAIFLSSRASDFVTGVALPVDGGFSSSMF